MAERTLLTDRRIAVIGAGPIGLEVALYAAALGASVRVYEAGAVAAHVGEWGHVQLFTAFGMNRTPLGRRTLEGAGCRLPDDSAFQTAAEWRERYLLPLAQRTVLADALTTGSRVLSVGRGNLLKGDHIGDGRRSDHRFSLLVEEKEAERYEEADIVLDCSGSWGNPNWLGAGGLPALGERAARERITYHPVDVAGSERKRYAGRRTLLVGDGLSAATTAVAMAELAGRDPGTQLVWITRSPAAAPIRPIEDDPLRRRAELTQAANVIATRPAPGVEWMPGCSVVSIRWMPDLQHFDVVLSTPSGDRGEQFDEVIANVGYRPDNSIYRELQIHECYASGAPMKLAASLLAASADAGGDCLKLGGFGPEVLVNPEPGFFILGMKSYGRNSAFLLQSGHEQVRDVFRLLTGEAELDLFAQPDVTAEV
jgi:hypothetical protein